MFFMDPVARLDPSARHAPAPSPFYYIARAWRDTVAVFAARGPALVFWAIAGLASIRLVILFAGVVLGERLFVHTHGIFVTLSGLLSVSSLFGRRMLGLLVAQVILSGITIAIARGAITALALHPLHEPRTDSQLATFKQACCRFPALLAGTFVTGAFHTLIAVSLMAPMIAMRFDPAQSALPNANVSLLPAIPQAILAQTVNLGTSTTQSPFAGFVPYWRNVAFRDQPIWVSQAPATESERGESQGISIKRSQSRVVNGPFVGAVIAGMLVLVIVGELLLRFNAAFAMDAAGARKAGALNALVPLVQSVKLGARRLDVMTLYGVLLGASMLVASLAFIVLPNVLAQGLTLPEAARASGQAWLAPAATLLATASLTVIGAIGEVFVIVCDARLYAALKPTG